MCLQYLFGVNGFALSQFVNKLFQREFGPNSCNTFRYLRVVRERDLNEVVKEGVDTLLLRLYSELRLTKELEQLSSSPNSCVLVCSFRYCESTYCCLVRMSERSCSDIFISFICRPDQRVLVDLPDTH